MSSITNSSIAIEGAPGDYISVFAHSGQAAGVSLQGLKYELIDECISDDYPIGISNEFTDKPAVITVDSGTLIISCPVSAKIGRYVT